MKLFDTHSHLTDERFDEDREALLAALPGKSVALVLDCATEPGDWDAVEALSVTPYVYVAYGIHPHSAGEAPPNYLEMLEKRLKQPKCVAVGEIGLDYHYDFSPREVQKRILIEQIELAVALDLPVVIHDREAHQDVLNILRQFKGRLRGEMHCYSGSAEMLRDVLDLGFYLGFGGSLTFKNAVKTVKAAAAAPLDSLLIETDSPYMTPEPFRGKRNDPSLVRYPCAKLAEIKGMDVEEMAALTYENGKRLFGID